MKYLALLLMAAGSLRFEITDLRGRKASGVALEAGEPDADGWRKLQITKSRTDAVIVWPFDSMVKDADGPGSTPVIVATAASPTGPFVAAGALLRHEKCDDESAGSATDPFSKGVALLCAGKAVDAVEPLSLALKERERQLTRVPSEIYAAAMLFGKASLAAGKFDSAAVAFLKASRLRPSDPAAKAYRAEALTRAGKPEAAPIQ